MRKFTLTRKDLRPMLGLAASLGAMMFSANPVAAQGPPSGCSTHLPIHQSLPWVNTGNSIAVGDVLATGGSRLLFQPNGVYSAFHIFTMSGQEQGGIFPLSQPAGLGLKIVVGPTTVTGGVYGTGKNLGVSIAGHLPLPILDAQVVSAGTATATMLYQLVMVDPDAYKGAENGQAIPVVLSGASPWLMGIVNNNVAEPTSGVYCGSQTFNEILGQATPIPPTILPEPEKPTCQFQPYDTQVVRLGPIDSSQLVPITANAGSGTTGSSTFGILATECPLDRQLSMYFYDTNSPNTVNHYLTTTGNLANSIGIRLFTDTGTQPLQMSTRANATAGIGIPTYSVTPRSETQVFNFKAMYGLISNIEQMPPGGLINAQMQYVVSYP